MGHQYVSLLFLFLMQRFYQVKEDSEKNIYIIKKKKQSFINLSLFIPRVFPGWNMHIATAH